jgi:DNA polymerase III subunit alpha
MSAKKLEGAIRNTGVHACGVIITPEEVSNLVPVSIAAKDANIQISQFDNSVAEDAGLLKMDFLGLRTLTIIKDAVDLVKIKHNISIEIDEIPLDDPKTYQLFKDGRTVGIFQYESAGMQKYMRELKPDKFDDLIAMNALYRPGPIKYIPNFIARKHGSEEIEYDLPEVQEFLEETYGITVYQEQVMLLSQKLANFTKGQADTLRKAMGKKQRDVLDKMFPQFLEGGRQNKLNEEKLHKIWQDWIAFTEYAFNKSHSTCYAYIAYQTAYLKANYPAEYMAALMSNNINNTKQLAMFMEDCKDMGVDVLGPDVNESRYDFAVNHQGQIRFGLGAIKGMGEGPSEAICKQRDLKGNFENIYDFFERMGNNMNKRVVESLVYAGAFDDLDANFHRAQYFALDDSSKVMIEKLLKFGQSSQELTQSVENSLFADFANEVQVEQPKFPNVEPWPNMYKLNKEREIIGLYLSAHPLDEYKIQYEFIKGELSNPKRLLSPDEIEAQEANDIQTSKTTTTAQLDHELEPENDADDMADVPLEDGDFEILEDTEQIEAQGPFKFLTLDQLDKFGDMLLADLQKKSPSNEPYDYRNRQQDSGPEYMVSGIISEYQVKDGRDAGTKMAILALEDYKGSKQFMLFDKDYMRLKDKLSEQRFVMLKIRFSPNKDRNRMYLNIAEVFELKDALDLFAKKLSLLIRVDDFKAAQLQDLLQQLKAAGTGKQSLHFIFKNLQHESTQAEAKNLKINLDAQWLHALKSSGQYEFVVN